MADHVDVAALATAGAMAAMFLEVTEPIELAIVERCVPATAVALALLMVEVDEEFAPRWLAAGSDWMARGEVLRDALLYILRPVPAVPS